MAKQKSEISVLNSKIDALGKKTAKWRDDVQVILVACAKHAFEHNNVDPFTRLVGVLQGADMAAVIKWVDTFTPARWSKKDVAFKFNKSFEGAYDGLFLLGQAWWDLAKKPAQISSTFDVLEVLRDLIKRSEREVEAGKKEVKHADLILELKALSGKEAMKAA